MASPPTHAPEQTLEWDTPLFRQALTQFEQAGLLSRQHFETGKAVYELNQGGHHDHLVCLQCGRVEEFYDPDIEKRFWAT